MGRFESPIATRGASGKALNYIFDELGILMGGSADLGVSNKTNLDNSSFIRRMIIQVIILILEVRNLQWEQS